MWSQGRYIVESWLVDELQLCGLQLICSRWSVSQAHNQNEKTVIQTENTLGTRGRENGQKQREERYTESYFDTNTMSETKEIGSLLKLLKKVQKVQALTSIKFDKLALNSRQRALLFSQCESNLSLSLWSRNVLNQRNFIQVPLLSLKIELILLHSVLLLWNSFITHSKTFYFPKYCFVEKARCWHCAYIGEVIQEIRLIFWKNMNSTIYLSLWISMKLLSIFYIL